MAKIQTALVIIIIIFFLIGVWPVSLAALGAMFYIRNIQQPQEPTSKKNIEELQKENEALRQELADQAVRRAMDKAERREKED